MLPARSGSSWAGGVLRLHLGQRVSQIISLVSQSAISAVPVSMYGPVSMYDPGYELLCHLLCIQLYLLYMKVDTVVEEDLGAWRRTT